MTYPVDKDRLEGKGGIALIPTPWPEFGFMYVCGLTYFLPSLTSFYPLGKDDRRSYVYIIYYNKAIILIQQAVPLQVSSY